MKVKRIILKVLQFICWCINFAWLFACLTALVFTGVAVTRWAIATLDMPDMPMSSFGVNMMTYIFAGALLGLVMKLMWKYWSDKGTQNGMELIKWDGQSPPFQNTKVDVKKDE